MVEETKESIVNFVLRQYKMYFTATSVAVCREDMSDLVNSLLSMKCGSSCRYGWSGRRVIETWQLHEQSAVHVVTQRRSECCSEVLVFTGMRH